ncbi:unnamed protein product [Symbiodinium natans]|uniref:Uncharacterized protein n=1 Tax=Symbiodinium natans TaxID=878477 RepID=A0A812R9R2_9DINO|nr:unnamed protein product [Symbiodinium natans]
MSEKFEPPVDAGDCSYLFEVRQLADRYQQKDLMIQAEKELMKLLSPENVLEFLAHVVGSGCQLEAACLDMISENNCKMLKERKEELKQIVEQNTELTKVLMCLLAS